MSPTARRQRLAEALAAFDGAARRVRLLTGSGRPVARPDLQAMADAYAIANGDTPEVQAERREILRADDRAYVVGRPLGRAAA